MSSTEEVPFTKQMRNVTREIHNVSDALINAKLGIAMSEDRVWAEGLLIFYEIFKYLEEALDRLSHTLISDLDIPGMRRKEAFEKDLAFYLGSNWKDGYKPRESVCQYLKHLEKIEQENPYYLMSYIYHLYMGLLSGGQILRRKKVLLQKFSFSRKDVQLFKDGGPLGLSIIGGSDHFCVPFGTSPDDPGIYISKYLYFDAIHEYLEGSNNHVALK
ncbi:heme oxygenase-like [Penaeus vannamei]|uniref:heme oxygenase-like n=1 Tax=Penaeus vannamei TaxID=6689 RepID=UPI00387F4412